MLDMRVWAVLIGLLMAGWIIWAFREYSRTGKLQWLWMAALMSLGLLGTLSRALTI